MSIYNFYQKHIPERIKNVLWKLSWNLRFIFQFFPQHVKTYFNYLLHERDSFDYKLIVITKVKDEAGCIKEWIEYHKLVGVEKFIIFDNESTDNLKEVLQPYINSGEVEYKYVVGNLRAFQVGVVNKAIKKYRNKTKWIAVIDADEFIVPVGYENIPDAISAIEADLGKKLYALAINWVMYGYSGHKVKPEGLVIENFTKSGGINAHIKSIVNPRAVSYFLVHNAICMFSLPQRTEKGVIVREGKLQDISDASIEKLRINHYYTKSYEECIKKFSRRYDILNIKEKEFSAFDPNFMSDNEDRIMDNYIPKIKEAMS